MPGAHCKSRIEVGCVHWRDQCHGAVRLSQRPKAQPTRTVGGPDTPDVPHQPAFVNERISLFGNPGMYYPRTDYFNMLAWTSFYNTAPLIRTLAKHVDFGKLGPANFKQPAAAQAPRLILTATNLASGTLDKFDSKQMRSRPHTCAPAAVCHPVFRRPRRRRRTVKQSNSIGTAGCSTIRRSRK